MTKTLEQIQEENRKQIILANNPEAKDYDEALDMEVGFGCKVIASDDCPEIINKTGWHHSAISGDVYKVKRWSVMDSDSSYVVEDKHYLEQPEEYKHWTNIYRIKQIIGKPLTLDRVILTLQNIGDGDLYWNYNEKPLINLCGYWDLTKPTLEEQTEDCQREINKLIKTKLI